MNEPTQIERADRQVNVRLTPSVYQAIKSAADEDRRSFTAQINLDLERFYELDGETKRKAA